MKLIAALLFLAGAATSGLSSTRLVILKVDGLNADLLAETIAQTDTQTGKSTLPWLDYIFRQRGTVFRNFYVRGISLSAPSWSMLDTGHHTVIRGNVEFDRYTGEVYDYLNFFPFYVDNARSRVEDMPGVRVLDDAGIRLVIDRYPPAQVFQSFQLFQRLVQWPTLANALKLHFSSKSMLSMFESGDAPSFDQSIAEQTERNLIADLHRPEIRYLDFYTGAIDHEGHATNQRAALVQGLKEVDALAGRIWLSIQETSSNDPTLFVMVSDHGMNNDPAVFSQAFNLPDLLNSPQGGAHHVVTNRHQLSDYKLMGLDPWVHRVVTPSTASFYLKGQADNYPTAWMDLDGNERASLHLRNSDWNELHILLNALQNPDLAPITRRAAVRGILRIVNRNRAAWTQTIAEMTEELASLEQAISERRAAPKSKPRSASKELRLEVRAGTRRRAGQLQEWLREETAYQHYLSALKQLLTFDPPASVPLTKPIRDFIPEMALGDNNSVFQLQHYVAGPAIGGLAVTADGELDEEHSFRRLDYLELFASQRVRNNPQPALNSNPIDFVARRLPDAVARQFDAAAIHAYWLSANALTQLIVLSDAQNRLALRTISQLAQDAEGVFSWQSEPWRAGLPLHLFEDAALHLSAAADRAEWLNAWHSEQEWLQAIHECAYSNGVIGITEQFSPVADNVPGTGGMPPLLLRFERRRRELVTPDLEIFAADHWNFNARNFNPGGNHGSFLRISTHSVWMMAGAGIPIGAIEEPEDSLNFASTILSLAGQIPPLPDRVVNLARPNQ